MTEPELNDPWWHLLQAQQLLGRAGDSYAEPLIRLALAHATLARRIAEVTLAEQARER